MPAHGFEMPDALAPRDRCKDCAFLVEPIRRDEPRYRLAKHLAGRVAKNMGRAIVPACHDALEIFANDRVAGGFDNFGKQKACSRGLLALGGSMEDQHGTRDVASRMDGDAALANGRDGTIAAAQKGVAGQLVFVHQLCGEFINQRARVLFSALEYGIERLANGSAWRPAGQALSLSIDKRHTPVGIGGKNGIAQAGERERLKLLAGLSLPPRAMQGFD